MRHLLKLFLITAAAVCLAACRKDDAQTTSALQTARALMQDRPDSALAILQSMPHERIRTRKARAEHALLYSMALDKNYIDLKSDSIISVATAWYRRHGSPDDRLKAYFYLGRIYLNASEPEKAVEAFHMAEKFADKAEDLFAVALLYHWTANVYMDNYDKRSIEYFIKCSQVHAKANNFGRYIRARLNLTVALDRLETHIDISPYDTLSKLVILKETEPYVTSLSDDDATSYYLQMMDVLQESADTTALRSLLYQYIERYQYDPIQTRWLNVANNAMFIGELNIARDALKKFKTYNITSRTLFDNDSTGYELYHIYSARLYEKLGQYDKMMASYRRYLTLRDSIMLQKHLQDTQFTGRRIELESEQEKTRRNIAIWAFALTAAVAVGAIISVRMIDARKRKRLMQETVTKYAKMVDQMEQQLELEQGKTPLSKAMRHRMRTADAMIATALVGEDVTAKIDKIMADKESFIQETYCITQELYPKTMARLKEMGLDDNEMRICSLYICGGKMKDISSYLGKRNCNMIIASIREKLGLKEGDSQLKTYLKSLINDIE